MVSGSEKPFALTIRRAQKTAAMWILNHSSEDMPVASLSHQRLRLKLSRCEALTIRGMIFQMYA